MESWDLLETAAATSRPTKSYPCPYGYSYSYLIKNSISIEELDVESQFRFIEAVPIRPETNTPPSHDFPPVGMYARHPELDMSRPFKLYEHRRLAARDIMVNRIMTDFMNPSRVTPHTYDDYIRYPAEFDSVKAQDRQLGTDMKVTRKTLFTCFYDDPVGNWKTGVTRTEWRLHMGVFKSFDNTSVAGPVNAPPTLGDEVLDLVQRHYFEVDDPTFRLWLGRRKVPQPLTGPILPLPKNRDNMRRAFAVRKFSEMVDEAHVYEHKKLTDEEVEHLRALRDQVAVQDRYFLYDGGAHLANVHQMLDGEAASDRPAKPSTANIHWALRDLNTGLSDNHGLSQVACAFGARPFMRFIIQPQWSDRRSWSMWDRVDCDRQLSLDLNTGRGRPRSRPWDKPSRTRRREKPVPWNPLIKVSIDSRIPGTKLIAASRKFRDRLIFARDYWLFTHNEALLGDRADDVFLTWQGKRLLDTSSAATLGIKPDYSAHSRDEPRYLSQFGILEGGLHLTAWTEELYTEYLQERQDKGWPSLDPLLDDSITMTKQPIRRERSNSEPPRGSFCSATTPDPDTPSEVPGKLMILFPRKRLSELDRRSRRRSLDRSHITRMFDWDFQPPTPTSQPPDRFPLVQKLQKGTTFVRPPTEPTWTPPHPPCPNCTATTHEISLCPWPCGHCGAPTPNHKAIHFSITPTKPLYQYNLPYGRNNTPWPAIPPQDAVFIQSIDLLEQLKSGTYTPEEAKAISQAVDLREILVDYFTREPVPADILYPYHSPHLDEPRHNIMNPLVVGPEAGKHGSPHFADKCPVARPSRCKCVAFPTFHTSERCHIRCSRRCGGDRPRGSWKHRNAMTCKSRCCMCGIHGHSGRECRLKRCRCGSAHLGQDCSWRVECREMNCDRFLCGVHCRGCGGTERPFVEWMCRTCRGEDGMDGRIREKDD